ncbi:MAG TPA: DNA polymerase Y family protein, partial [Planctomycetaceae bacterium]|nr:DNA polymerase Y family protein [Planctomycetaceae bacterium]
MTRALCIWLPDWPLQRLRVARPELEHAALVLFAPRGRRGQVVSACAPEAHEHGVFPGLPLAEAQTLLQHTTEREWRFEPADPDADLIALRALAGMCQTFGSLVALETDSPPSSLLIDVSGCASHFGGERGLLRAVTEEFSGLGLNIRTALAESFGGAWGVAHFGAVGVQPSGCRENGVIVPRGRLREALHPLPLAALRLPAKVIQAFAELDVLSVVQLERIPRDSLVARFGNEVLLRIDQA